MSTNPTTRQTATYQVGGMTCGGCSAAVTKAIHAIDADLKVDVDLESGAVKVEGAHDPGALRQAVEDSGFDVAA